MTRDTDYPKETVEEREHGVFVPPNEQHVREDGSNTAPAESAEDRPVDSTVDRGADRVDAVGTEAVPDTDPSMDRDTDRDRRPDPEPAFVDPEPATPLDTGTAEDAERSDDMPTSETRVDDIAAEDEAHATDVATHVDASNADASSADASSADAVDVDSVDVDSVDVNSVETDYVDADDVAVGTAAVPGQATTQAAEGFWPSGLVDDLRGRWDMVQMRFVDDPSGVASDAKALVGETVTAMRDAVDRLEARLEEAVAEADEDTEQLRQQVSHYRDVFESLLSR